MNKSLRSGHSSEIDLPSIFSSVLLVEDEPAHAALIKRVLNPIFGEVTHVSTGQEALRAAESSFFELVLSDLHLPDISGVEVLRAVRQLRPGLPVIVLTSSNNLDDAVSAMREGAWDYMVKQFTTDFAEGLKLVINRTAERKQLQIREMQLRSERRNFWAAAHAAQDGLAILGTHGSVVFANEAFSKFVSLVSPNHREGMPLNIIELAKIHDASIGAALEQQLSQRRQDILWNSEFHVPPKPGETSGTGYYFDLSLSSVQLEEFEDSSLGETPITEFHRSILWVRDITRRREQERFQRDILSTTSHDLKGPLGAIITSAELLGDDKFLRSDRGQDIVTRIASCARNCLTIIDELLSARRIQDGVLVVKPKFYPVEEFLEETLLDYLPTAKAKSITLTVRPVSSELEIYADRIGLHRVLGNLVSNAVKFTPKGGRVELSAQRIADEVHVSVSDTGTGIEASARHKLFERYSRLDKHNEIEGTGLGLFVTKNIIEAHGGRINIQSEVGVGTVFTVVLPDSSASAKLPQSEAAASQ